MKNKLAMFDLDGTLFDTSKVNYLSYKQALNENGFELSQEYFEKFCFGRHYKQFIPPIIGNDEAMLEKIHVRKKKLYKTLLIYAAPNEHLFNMARLMKEEYYLAVVTTASGKNVSQILEYFGYEDFFDLLITQEDVVKKKPDPECYFKAMNYFNVNAKQTILFEDSDECIQSAVLNGIKAFKII